MTCKSPRVWTVVTLSITSFILGFSLTLEAAEPANGKSVPTFHDRFDVDHDFLAKGVIERGWDGFLGKGSRETADRIAAADGKLHLQSTNGRYQEGWNPLGPLLYKNVVGDFKATVRIVDYKDISFNNAGIMARAAKPDDAGKGEDWISIDYFPIYGGIYARMADNNRRSEKGSNGQGRSADKFLQMELVGNLFFLRYSADGVVWHELPASPITRNDLVNVPLQVGLFQATYSGNQGEVSFDDFSLECGGQVRTARIPSPADGAIDQAPKLTLSWVPGSGAQQHDVYIGTSREAVENATRESAEYKGRQEATDIAHQLTGLADGQDYFWRVDEVTGETVSKGEIWSFTIYNRSLADFEEYKSTDDLTSQWSVKGRGSITLAPQDASSGQRSMKLEVNNTRAAAVLAFPENQDWLSSTYGFRSLRVRFKGDPTNQLDRLIMAFEDNDWGNSRTFVKYEGDPASLKESTWTTWDIDLQRLVENNPVFRLDNVKKIGLGMSGSGTICFDDISIEYPRPASNAGEAWPKYVQPDRFVKEVPFNNITVTGGLWRERMNVNRTVSLPHVWGRCEYSTRANGEDSTRLENFLKAAGKMDGPFSGLFFNDSDVYKIIEGTANSLRNHPDPELEAYTDKVIDSIAAAQWDDGYVFTFFSIPDKQPQKRWRNIGHEHELYCAGHMIEAAVAYYEATGKRKLLDVSIRFADLICDTFAPGKKETAPGHQEIELALIKLSRVTGDKKYLETGKFFIDQRGQANGRGLYGTYSQDHVPFVEQEKGVGHSVRAGYLYCAATDIAAMQHDEAYANTLYRVWDNIVNRKTYLTGGIGQPGGPEGFAGDYELGNSCYAETCSGIAFAMWNHRLHQMTGESKYADLIERTFLNNMLSSLSFEGEKHYYTNPLMTNGRERWEWPGHDCACCPSNLVRVISSISGYAYSHNDDTILVNQYIASEGTVPFSGNPVKLTQSTRYPWDGDIAIDVGPKTPATFTLKLRIPGWARNEPMPGNLYKYIDKDDTNIALAVNGAQVDAKIENGYVAIERKWQTGDTIRLNLPMPIRRVVAHPKAVADKGLVAIERGPFVYCAEFKDNTIDVGQLKLADDDKLTATFEEDFFGGAVTLTSESGLKLIPYYLYSNRGRGWMRVWMPRVETP